MNTVTALRTVKKNVQKLVEGALGETGGLLRLAPCWVPRSFLQPGKRLKLHPDDLYAYGLNRGGIDERWFASTTPAANENRTPDEGLSYVRCWTSSASPCRPPSRSAVPRSSARRSGRNTSKWPVYSKFFDNMGPIPHHMHQIGEAGEARRPGRQARVLLFPAAAQQRRQQFPLHLHGLRARHDESRRSGNASRIGTRATTASSISRKPTGSKSAPAGSSIRASSTRPARSALMSRSGAPTFSACINRSSKAAKSHGPCSSRTCQSRSTRTSTSSWTSSTGTKTSTRTSRTTITSSPSPSPTHASEGFVDRWIVYGKVDGEQLFTAKELTVDPGAKCTIKDTGAYGLICVQGVGKINGQPLNSAQNSSASRS